MIRTGPWKPIPACSISVDEIAVKTQREPADVPIRVFYIVFFLIFDNTTSDYFGTWYVLILWLQQLILTLQSTKRSIPGEIFEHRKLGYATIVTMTCVGCFLFLNQASLKKSYPGTFVERLWRKFSITQLIIPILCAHCAQWLSCSQWRTFGA